MTQKKWTPDFMHSEVHFKAKHLMINNVTGTFQKWNATMESHGDDFENANVSFTADVASINTGMEMRDNHLKSEEFFHAEKHPELKFYSIAMNKKSDNHYQLDGNLTIRDVTKPITLQVEYGGQMVDFYGNIKAGFEINGIIKRKEFGLAWDAITEAGGIVVSDDIKLTLNIQMQQQKEA